MRRASGVDEVGRPEDVLGDRPDTRELMVHHHPERFGATYELFAKDKRVAGITRRGVEFRGRGACQILRGSAGQLRLVDEDGTVRAEAVRDGSGQYTVSASGSMGGAELVVIRARDKRQGVLRQDGLPVLAVEIGRGLSGPVVHTADVPDKIVAVCVAVTLGRWIRKKKRKKPQSGLFTGDSAMDGWSSGMIGGAADAASRYGGP